MDVQSDHDAFKNMLFTPSKLFDRLFETDSVMNQFDIGTVNISHSSDATLLAELQMIMDIMKKVGVCFKFRFYWCPVSGFPNVSQGKMKVSW